MGGRFYMRMRIGIALLLTVMATVSVDGQINKWYDEYSESDGYSHWTAGISVGEPLIFCNLSSFAHRKTYWGVSFGAFGGYQVNPVFGVNFLVDYGMNKAGARTFAQDRKLGPDGSTYYLSSLPGTPFAEIYSKIHFLNIGIQPSFNLNRVIFQPAHPQRFNVLLQPAVYLQHFHSTVYNMKKVRVTDGSLNRSLDFGAGADLALRARLNAHADVQLSSGIVWTTNNRFDGTNSMSKAKDDFIWHTKVSLVYKFNRASKGERDNILYAPTRHAAPAAAPQPAYTVPAPTSPTYGKEVNDLLLQLLALMEKRQRDTVTTIVKVERVVDTLYIMQPAPAVAQPAPQQPAPSTTTMPPYAYEEWILRLITRIRNEHPEMMNEVSEDSLVRQIVQAKEEYADFYSDEKGASEADAHTPKFAIQIYAMTNPFPDAFFKDIPGVRMVRLTKDRLYRYLISVFDTKEEAREQLSKVQEKYWDAFIREFDNYMIKNAVILNEETKKQ